MLALRPGFTDSTLAVPLRPVAGASCHQHAKISALKALNPVIRLATTQPALCGSCHPPLGAQTYRQVAHVSSASIDCTVEWLAPRDVDTTAVSPCPGGSLSASRKTCALTCRSTIYLRAGRHVRPPAGHHANLPAGGARFFREHRLHGGVASTKGCGYHSRLAMPRRVAICEQEDTCDHLPVRPHDPKAGQPLHVDAVRVRQRVALATRGVARAIAAFIDGLACQRALARGLA